MTKIKLQHYDILIKENLIQSFNTLFKALNQHTKRLYFITDEQVFKLYQATIESALYDFSIIWTIVKPGESAKSFSIYEKTIEQLIEKGILKDDYLVAFGGGVIGDLAGFIAATLFRGISYVQIPTTLLAQVDSSIGSKTAINTSFGKNLVGSFYEPNCVLIDPIFLKTLDKRELYNGAAEMIKAGLLGDKKLFELLESKETIDVDLIKRAIFVKKKIVTLDPFEKNERQFLNLGHTFGHAIEKTNHYQTYKHGEAISYGMIMALEIGVENNITDPSLYERVKKVLLSYDLIKEPLLNKNQFIKDIWTDKKMRHDGLTLIVLSDIEKPEKIKWVYTNEN